MAFQTEKVKLTPEGGVAVLMDCSSEDTFRHGEVVHISSGILKAIEVDIPDPVGVVYGATSSSTTAWVVVSGIAQVLFNVATTAGHLARGYFAADGAGYEAGCAITEEFPTSPFATDKHFFEIGHVLEAVSLTNGYAIARTVIHFN